MMIDETMSMGGEMHSSNDIHSSNDKLFMGIMKIFDDVEKKTVPNTEYDNNGFSRRSNRSCGDLRNAHKLQVEEVNKWKILLENFESTERCEIKSMVYNSVPQKLRPHIWLRLASLKQSSWSSKYKYNKSLLNSYQSKWDKCEKLPSLDNENLRQIMLDTARTYGEHYYFENENSEGKIRLARLLKNFSYSRKDLGYCQGMNEIAATVILVVDDDVMAFTIFSEIIERLEGYFVREMWELKEDIQLFEFLLGRQSPELLNHLKKNDIEISMFFTKWVLSLFSFLKFNQHVRCIDMVLLEGIKAIYKLALSIFSFIEDKLMKMEGLDTILPFLLSVHDNDIDIHLESIYPDIPIEEYLQAAPRFSFKKSLKRQHVRQSSR